MLGVLIADDEVFARTLVREMLNVIPDVSFFEAGDGVAALEQARVCQPKVIILDIMMPEMNGVEVCRVIKSDPALSAIPVILVTGSDDPVHRFIARRVGASGFLRKPFDEAEFLGVVMAALQSRA